MSFNEPSLTHRKQLTRGITAAGAMLLVLNSVIGAGIFQLPAAVYPEAGIWSPWLFLVIGVLIITIVLTFAELASYFKNSGGPVLYTTTAFGPLIGFSTGWILFISRMTAFAANTTVMALYLGDVVPWFADGIGRSILIVAVCGALTYANFVGVRAGVRAMAVITFFKLVPLALMILLGLQYVSGSTLIPSAAPVFENIGGTTLLLIYAFVGFEGATIISGETKNPTATLPRALVNTTLMIGVIYFLIVLTYISVVPEATDGSATVSYTHLTLPTKREE